MGRWDPAKKRQNHAKLRLAELKRAFPHLGDDVLAHTTLRELSQAARRAGRNQSSLPQGVRQPTEGCGEASEST